MRNAVKVMMNQRNAKAKTNAKDFPAMDTEVYTNNEKVGDDDIIMDKEPFSTVAAKRAPTVDLTQLPHRVLLYIVFVVAKGGSRSTGDKIRSRTGKVIDMIISGYDEPGHIAFTPLKPTDLTKAITKGSQLPLKFSGIGKFVAYINGQEDFTKFINS